MTLPRRFQLSKERFRPDTSRMEKMTREATYYKPPEYARMFRHLDELRPALAGNAGARRLFRIILQCMAHERPVDWTNGRGVP